ncbi:two component response regulator sensor protein [Leptospira ryugenii]|uniref:Two component response regulator sensor protein n=1 Tax=Leptospira ryugenii TaxID=1917863 RepID=A0A2P2E2B7_9LEPT|nr:response regulator [Leptospira ryugenii]GBF51021.1 two component response regulator sensor protein [Leptospira ryugenii]
MSSQVHVLLIEDEPGIREVIGIALQKEEILVTPCETGREGIQSLTPQIQLVILDIGLPDTNGFDVLKEIRTKSSVPVILLTAREEEIDKVLGLELGADDYIVKPFSPRELVARIRAILRRIQKPIANDSPFRIDLERKVIHYFGAQLFLSPYEYKTLSLFLKYPGRIFTREEIMDSVWTEPEDSFDRAVDTVIKNIRARCKEIKAEKDPIETRRGLGYGVKQEI